ncbi:response regulator [Ancylobacter sp. G4_0304]|uniref:response regulator n=1 Tax=Ancylobacter sp. G4_0304 TaxID=3114289 RepID=UPI0039C61543
MGTEIGRVAKPEDLATDDGGASGRELTLLRATLENMAQGVAMYDARHRLVTWNPLFREYLDMPDEFLGTEHTFSDYIRYLHGRGEFGDADVEVLLAKRLKELDHSHQFERVRPDGTVLEVRRDPIPGGGFIAIYTDITERKRAEQKLKDEEERLRQIDGAAPVGLVIVAWPSRIIRHVNPCFARMFRKDAAQFIGKSIEGLLDDPEKGREFGDVMGRLPTGPQEFSFVKQDGTTCYTMVFGGALDFMDDPSIIATVSDISDRVRMEDELREAKEAAESASQVKSAFLANMSHELRTPLNAIIGYSEILQEDARDDGNDALVADLEKIQGAGKHLLGLINDILDLSKIEAGRMDVYLEQVFLTRLVDEVKTIVSPMMKKNANSLVIDCPPDIGSVRTDLTKLKQSLINLLSNAAKFTKEGKVTLSLARVPTAEGGEEVRLSVSDSGIGMSEEQMGRLFQAFTQADASTTRNFGGTGLGLTITKHFVAMLGGTIEVTSAPGEGATFTIRLPQDVAGRPVATPDELPEPSALDKVRHGAITVLVVDDDAAVHEVLAATLGKEGYHLIHAHDGHEALEIMRREPPDIVTLDVMMPKIDGWSVLGIMKSDPALDHIPVIMLTIVDDRTLGYSLGAAEYMTKPIDRHRLLALIHKFAPTASEMPILVVDDDADVRAMVRTTIEDLGIEVAEAGNGREALEWLAANPRPALILLDLMMPVMDGMEFLERVRGMPKFTELPIVVLTAKELTAEERNFLARNTLLILSKSAQPIGTLGAALAAIAGRGTAGRSHVEET